METVDNRSFKDKMKDGYTKFKWKVEDAWIFIKNNPKETAVIATATAATVKTIFKIGKSVVAHAEGKTVYCNDIQSSVRLKHELRYNEARELRDRMDAGQTKFSALDEMGLLKR